MRKDSCFETSLAFVLGIPEEEVPFFTNEDPSKWLTNAKEWLKERGFVVLHYGWQKGAQLQVSGARFIAIGDSPNQSGVKDGEPKNQHAVVMQNEEIIFDCADGIVGEPEYTIYVFADPASAVMK